MADQTVWSLKPMVIYRYVLGIGQFPTQSRKIRLLSKLFALLVVSIIVCLHCVYTKYNIIIKLCNCFEYLIYVLISYRTGDQYIYKFCRYLDSIDNFSGAHKNFKRLVFLTWFFIIMSFILRRVIMWFLYTKPLNLSLGIYILIIFTTEFMFIACDSCRFICVLIFGLLYCRVKSLNQVLTSEFEAMQNRINIGSYIQKYLLIVDTLKEIDYPLKVLIGAYLLNLAQTWSFSMFQSVVYVKTTDSSSTTFTIISVFYCLSIMPLLLISMALDLVAGNINYMRLILIEKKMNSVNERQRDEVDQMLQILKNRPLTYTVCRIGPLSVRLALNMISFALITTMGALQIKGDVIS